MLFLDLNIPASWWEMPKLICLWRFRLLKFPHGVRSRRKQIFCFNVLNKFNIGFLIQLEGANCYPGSHFGVVDESSLSQIFKRADSHCVTDFDEVTRFLPSAKETHSSQISEWYERRQDDTAPDTPYFQLFPQKRKSSIKDA